MLRASLLGSAPAISSIIQIMNRGLEIVAAALVSTIFAVSVGAHLGSDGPTFEPKAYYRMRCASCHGSRAESRFNPDLPEQQMVEAILYGRKAERPPDMPSFGDKGINEERAKGLIAYMRAVKR